MERLFTYMEFFNVLDEYNFKPEMIEKIWNLRPSDYLDEDALRIVGAQMAKDNPRGYCNPKKSNGMRS